MKRAIRECRVVYCSAVTRLNSYDNQLIGSYQCSSQFPESDGMSWQDFPLRFTHIYLPACLCYRAIGRSVSAPHAFFISWMLSTLLGLKPQIGYAAYSQIGPQRGLIWSLSTIHRSQRLLRGLFVAPRRNVPHFLDSFTLLRWATLSRRGTS